MQVHLNTDPHVDGRHRMAEHLEIVMTDALGRFSDRITRVEAYLSDVNGSSRTAAEEVHCTLEARLVGQPPVVVKEQAGSAHQALHGAVGKLKRAVANALDQRDARHGTAPPVQAANDADIDGPP